MLFFTMDSKHSPHAIYILQIHEHDKPLPIQKQKILLDLTQNGNNLTFGIMLLSTIMRVKKKINEEEFLIYYDSPVPLPLISTDLISVISKDDTQKYKQLNSDNYYHLVGINLINMVTIAEGRYLVNLLNHIPSILGDKYTPNPPHNSRYS